MDNIKIFVRFNYDEPAAPIVETIELKGSFSKEKFKQDISEIIENRFRYLIIYTPKDIKQIVQILDYLNAKHKIEIDLDESNKLNNALISRINKKICYRVNTNIELRSLLNNIRYEYNISMPEEMFLKNYDELVNNQFIKTINIFNSNLDINSKLLYRCIERIGKITIDDEDYNTKEYIEILSKIENILKKIDGEEEFDKFMIIYRYLVSSINYDKESLKSKRHNAYNLKGALLEGKSVCSGYVEALVLLLNKVGIDCHKVFGNTREISEKCFPQHVWNQVKIKGKWYNCDVTWDSIQRDKNDYYEYCLISDNEFKRHYPLKNNQKIYKCDNSYDRKIIKIKSREENNEMEI